MLLLRNGQEQRIRPSRIPLMSFDVGANFGLCIDIVAIWFGIANGQISSIFNSYLSVTRPYFHFRTITRLNVNGFSSNWVYALILW